MTVDVIQVLVWYVMENLLKGKPQACKEPGIYI